MPTASQYVICPLDESHRILKHRMQPHLLKCERQHDMSKKSKCPYNITHIVDTIVFPVSIYMYLANVTLIFFVEFIYPDVLNV